MNTIRRCLTWMLALCMIFSLMPVTGTVTQAADRTLQVTFQKSEAVQFFLIEDETSEVLAPVELESGDDLSFRVVLTEAYETYSDLHVYANGTMLQAEDGIYTVENVTEDTKVTVAGCSKTALPDTAYHQITLPESEQYTVKPYRQKEEEGTRVIDGGIYQFIVNVAEAYSQTPITVIAGGKILTSNEDGVYTIQNVTEDIEISVSGTFQLNRYTVSYEFDPASYGLSLNGTTADKTGKGSFQVQYGKTLSLSIDHQTTEEPVLVQDYNHILMSEEGADGTYKIEAVKADLTLRIVPSSIGVSLLLNDSAGTGYGTGWDVGFTDDEGNLRQRGSEYTLAAGDNLNFYVRLYPGYTHSAVDVYARVNGSGMVLEEEKQCTITKSGPDQDGYVYYVYRIPSDLILNTNDNQSAVRSIQLTVASADARFQSRMPIQADSCQVRFYEEASSTQLWSSSTVSYGSRVSRPDTPERDGKIFAYWVNAAGRRYNFNKPVTGDLNLYAKWEDGYTVTFDWKTGSASKTVKKNGTVSAMTPKRSGYYLKQWQLNGEKYDFSSEVTKDITLQAVWVKCRSLSKTKVSGISAKTYTGKSFRPVVVAKDGTSLLEEDIDYTVRYGSNRNIGKGTVTLTGIGKYAGKKSLSFVIRPAKPKIQSVKRNGKKTLKISWKKAPGGVKYEVYRSTTKHGSYRKIKTVRKSTSSFNNNKLKSGKTYYYKIRSVKKVNGTTYRSGFSNSKGARAK